MQCASLMTRMFKALVRGLAQTWHGGHLHGKTISERGGKWHAYHFSITNQENGNNIFDDGSAYGTDCLPRRRGMLGGNAGINLGVRPGNSYQRLTPDHMRRRACREIRKRRTAALRIPAGNRARRIEHRVACGISTRILCWQRFRGGP